MGYKKPDILELTTHEYFEILKTLVKNKQNNDWGEWAKVAFIVRYLGQWKEGCVPSVEELIGKAPFDIPIEKNKSDVEEWKEWAKVKGLKCMS